jgi:signal peptidase I
VNCDPPVPEEPPWWQRLIIGKHPKRTLMRLGVLILLSYVVFKWVLVPVRIVGISMEPTYRNGKVNFINRWSYLRRLPQRGEVVGIRLVSDQVMLLKRVIALPGERVAIRSGEIYVNGVLLDEPYVRRLRYASDEDEVLVKEGYYYVIGDNREMPLEVHTHGAYPAQRLVGKVLF